jgi:hydrogenase maturation protein HypF
MLAGARTPSRRVVTVRGVVQGVGFRPHVHALASRLGLTGFVSNRAGSVHIEVEGAVELLAEFAEAVVRQAPPLAQIDEVHVEDAPVRGDGAFRIEVSAGVEGDAALVSPDVATCDDCLAELLDRNARRYRYPFTNCAHCGPRLTIVRGSPYDREQTTMAAFQMCPRCRAEYEDPSDRRFHAQPIACPACGPRLRLVLPRPESAVTTSDPLGEAVAALLAGRIGAIKGLGGYHLACDARSEDACLALRARKHRDEKPFAVLVADLAAAERVAHLGDAERALLQSRARPIVLARRREGAGLASAVAPGSALVGLMLPYTPIHHLLAREAGAPLVMTSGNLSDEPIAFDDEDALARLSGLADFFLVHDRAIHTRCDDSVARVAGDRVAWIRRSRGQAPSPVRPSLAVDRPTLAVGGQLKATFALAAEGRTIVSHHLGDLDHYAAYRAYTEAIVHYERLFRVTPARIVHDAHPDYASSRFARALAAERGVEVVAVQHHRAHVASVLAEHGLPIDDAIGVAFDGAGWGDDGAVWGGEIFVARRGTLARAAHLAYVPMPGGTRAMREPWRMAVAYLRHAGEPLAPVASRVPRPDLSLADQLLSKPALAPRSSSVGRLFDAVASLVGLRDVASFEGQAAIALESAADEVPDDGAYPSEIAAPGAAPLVLDVRPTIQAIVRDVARGVPAPRVARRFHAGLAALVVDACVRVRSSCGATRVALGGGVFVNAILASDCAKRLANAGFSVYLPRSLPANDGGLCFGQLAMTLGTTGEG